MIKDFQVAIVDHEIKSSLSLSSGPTHQKPTSSLGEETLSNGARTSAQERSQREQETEE